MTNKYYQKHVKDIKIFLRKKKRKEKKCPTQISKPF